MLPLAEVVLVPLAPAEDVRRQALAAYLDRHQPVLDAQGRPADEAALAVGVVVVGQEVVENLRLRRRSSMPIEDPVREVAVDVGEHLGHEVLADLTRVVAQAVRVPGISGEQQQAHVVERVALHSITVEASCTCGVPLASTYSTPRACPSPSVRTLMTRQWVLRSRLPVASASGTDVMPACQRSLLMGPKPRLRALYFVSG